MSRYTLLASFLIIMAVATTACGTGPTLTSGSGASSALASDTLRVGSLDDGLDKLKSYRVRMQYSLDGKSDANKAQSMSMDLTHEVVAASQDQHINVSTVTTGVTNNGGVEVYRVRKASYVFNSRAQGSNRCIRMSQQVDPTTVLKPSEILGGLQSVQLAKRGEVVDGMSANHYTADSTSFTAGQFATASGDIWISQNGGYVLRYSGQATRKDAKLDAGGESAIKWDYRIEDANRIDAIALPPECLTAKPPNMSMTAKLSKDIPLPSFITRQNTANGITTVYTTEDTSAAEAYYKKELTGRGWSVTLSNRDEAFIRSAWCSTPAYEAGTVAENIPQAMFIYSRDTRTLTIFFAKDDDGSSVMLMDSGPQ
jgi:hypothetical protein